MFSRRSNIPCRRVHNNNPPLRRRRNINIINPHARPRNHRQLARSINNLFGNLGIAPHQQRVVLGDNSTYFLFGQPQTRDNVEMRSEDVEAIGRDFVCREDFGAGRGGSV